VSLSLASFVRPHGGRADERAADPLHGGRINAKALGNAAYTFTSA
jgi:hypothetical protein